MKSSHRCSRCNSQRLGLLECLIDQQPGGESYRAVGSGDYQSTKPIDEQQWTDYQRVRTGPTQTIKMGTIEAYVCAGCGRLEQYVQDPQWVPFEKLIDFCWINPLLSQNHAWGVATEVEERAMSIAYCPKCQSQAVGLLRQLPDTLSEETHFVHQAVGMVAKTGQLVGWIEAYVCTKCGYLEPYVAVPEKIPFEELENFSWIGSKEGPYR
jgi:hypothetical protein